MTPVQQSLVNLPIEQCTLPDSKLELERIAYYEQRERKSWKPDLASRQHWAMDH